MLQTLFRVDSVNWMKEIIDQRNEQLRRANDPLPGSLPYDNHRPINVPARFDGQTLYQCLIQMHPHVGQQQWRNWFQLGHILSGDTPVAMETIVRAGHQYKHLFPDTIEPDVDSTIVVLWEDDWMIVVHKPAPLPVHPCGRFNRNTLRSLLGRVYEQRDLRVVHRLDANTTGLLILARSADAATSLRVQFEKNEIEKRYMVQCVGQPKDQSFTCDSPIAKDRGRAGLRLIDASGRSATTDFRVLRYLSDDSTLLEARPKTGRTNQIRIHLWAMGMPVSGDPAYLRNQQLAETQTLDIADPPMCLHAAELRLKHPATGEAIVIESQEPEWLRRSR